MNLGSSIGMFFKIIVLDWTLLWHYVVPKSNSVLGRHYGEHPMQFLDIFPSRKFDDAQRQSDTSTPTIVFVHGGAWGSGTPFMYRLLGIAMANKGFNFIVVGYRTFPCASMRSQVNDLKLAVRFIHNLKGKSELEGIGKESPIFLCGHSSGAHISLVLLLEHRPELDFIKGFIGLSGVYDLWGLYKWHQCMGIHNVGPMRVANGGLESFDANSPIKILEQSTKDIGSQKHNFLLIHSKKDTIVPSSLSEQMHRASSKHFQCRLCLLDNQDHLSVVTELMDSRSDPVQLQFIKQFCGLEAEPSISKDGDMLRASDLLQTSFPAA